jgi:ferredoxin--NADP+ reductase|tara:strand:- start:885 stop:2093 length:1209 start_codon:yes stop_codon:yes gene_type:complete
MKVVLIIGGAVSGSTAVKKLTDEGIRCVVVEQNRMPYGKIEDGLPRWHEKQRISEYFKIDDIISNDLVDFVPLTRIGEDISFEEIYNMGWSCIYFANGAWKDRSFPIKEIEQFDNFYYQNPFVYWFNHYHESSYNGPKVDIKDDAIVIGGGLASIDVCKITQLELVRQKVESKIENFDIIEMEHKGIPKYLEQYDLKYEDLGIKGTTLVYRRNVENMPLTTIPEDAAPEMVEKRKLARRKILNNTLDKFLFKVAECTQPVGLSYEDNMLNGIEVIENEIIDGKLIAKENSNKILHGNTFISSIGSLPEPIQGIPMDGSTYNIIDEDSGKFDELDKVHGMGNAITGKGNIKASRVSAKTVGDLTIDLINDIDQDVIDNIDSKVKEWQSKSSYDGNYFEWKAKK